MGQERPAKPENLKTRSGELSVFSQTKLEEILGFAAEALGTAIEKKVADKVEDIKGKVLKRLRDEPDEYHPETTQYVSQETPHLPTHVRTSRIQQSIRSTYRKKRYAKRFRNKVFLTNSCY